VKARVRITFFDLVGFEVSLGSDTRFGDSHFEMPGCGGQTLDFAILTFTSSLSLSVALAFPQIRDAQFEGQTHLGILTAPFRLLS